MNRKSARTVTAAHRAVEAAGMTVLAYSPGTGKTGATEYVGRHRKPRTPRRAALVPFLRLAALLLGLAALMALLPGPARAADPAPLTLTLADAHGWTPDAALDTTQVEAPAEADEWPVGAAANVAATTTAWAVIDVSAETAWVASLLADGWVSVGDIDGHPACYVDVAATSAIVCSDGWEDLS